LLLPLTPSMDFTSINEYFYKLFSGLLLILLIPIFIFIWVYLQPTSLSHQDANKSVFELFIVIGVITGFWILIFIFFNKKIKSVRNGQGLRDKLEKYFRITIVRYIIFSFCSLAFAISYYLTGDDVFTIFFIAQLIICGLLWPFATKVSRDLKLRGDEREMVYYKKDQL
jgi:hypothetical protein